MNKEFNYFFPQYASSFNMNPNKWMLVNFDCSLMWVKDRITLTQALVVDPLYLQHSYSEKAIDYRVSSTLSPSRWVIASQSVILFAALGHSP